MVDKKMGIEEIRDLLNLGESVVEDLEKHKSDDGKIDGMEITQTMVGNIPESIKAYIGYDKIDDEFKDLDSEEAMEIAKRGTAILQKLIKLFQP